MTRTEASLADKPERTQSTPARTRKADVSRERVLGAAAKIFAERGYAGTTMRAVADRVGLQAASIYYHYRSKEDLIEAVIGTALIGVSHDVRLAVASLPPGASGRERIDSAISAHLTSVLTFGDYALASRRVLGQVPAHVRRKQIALRDAYSDFWLELLATAHEAGELRADLDLHLARTFILGALNSALEWYKPQGKALQEIARQFSLLIDEGIFAHPRK
jgi:AcrR family transcriptional regulator